MDNYEDMDEQINDAANKIIAELRDGLKKNESSTSSRVAKIIGYQNISTKDIDEMTSKEKIITFFKAAIDCDHTTLKALTEGTSSAGGYLIPEELHSEIVRDIADKGFLQNEVTNIAMKTNVMTIPTLSSGPQITWTEEATEKSTTTATFSTATLTAKKMAAILYSSDELIEDSSNIDIVKLIIQLFAEKIGQEVDRIIVRGNGTTEPSGFTIHGSVGSRTCVGNLDFDNLINLEYDLPAKYNKNAKFYAHRNNIREMRKIKDTTDRYQWQDPVAQSQPATFHGFPVVEQNDLAESEIYFGDLKKAVWMGTKGGIKVKVSQDTTNAFTKDLTAIRVVMRMACNVVLPQALKKLVSIP